MKMNEKTDPVSAGSVLQWYLYEEEMIWTEPTEDILHS